MKKVLQLVLCCYVFACTAPATNNQIPDSPLKTDAVTQYLGQQKPGLTPERFAPGIISTDLTEKAAFIHPNGKEFYFTIEEGKDDFMNIMVSKLEEGVWSKPSPLPMPNKESFGPFITKDGSKLYFASIDLINEEDDRTEYNIWMMERYGDEWVAPKPLGPGVNTPDALELFPSVADDGTLYFKRFNFKDETEKIYYAEWEDGTYGEAKLFEADFNIKYAIEDPFVAPDESYVTFVPAGPDLFGPVHISFRDEQGNWTQPKNMGLDGALPSLSPNRKYMFFIKNGDVYWVDAKVLESLR